MAEALDILFDVCRFLETHAGIADEKGARSASRTVERINLALLALGKATDLIADWVIVVQVFKLTHGASGYSLSSAPFASFSIIGMLPRRGERLCVCLGESTRCRYEGMRLFGTFWVLRKSL